MSTKPFNISEITSVVKGRLQGDADDRIIQHLLTDSRRLQDPGSTLFFALKTPKNDGHQYVAPLIALGVKTFIVHASFEIPVDIKGVAFIVVDSTLDALQRLATENRLSFKGPVVGITGSNGKTMVKEWLAILMEPYCRVVRNPKSYNSQIGVPLSVWEINEHHDIGIFEAGISEPNEMDRLQKIIHPTIGIFTNVGCAHDEHFINHNQKVAEKLRLFTKVDQLIYCADHVEINERVQSLESFKEIPLFLWSRKNSQAQLYVHQEYCDGRMTRLKATFQDHELVLDLPFSDHASIENLIHCWTFMLSQGYTNDQVQRGVSQLSPLEMRLQLKEAVNHCSLINDSYSSDYNSLVIALDFLNQQQQHARKTVILSDLLQSGRSEHELYSEIAQLLSLKKIERVIGIGPAMMRQGDLFTMEKHFFSTTDAFIRNFPLSNFQDETILLKGARVFAFEQIDHLLQRKSHETVMEVNLDAMQHNLNYYRTKLAPGVRLMSMVKAYSYGSGSFEVANFLQFNNVDYLTVAYADEGVELRARGIRLPIMVMNPEENAVDAMIHYELEPEVYSFKVWHYISVAITERPLNTPMKIHLKLDTGMHRLGFSSEEIEPLMQEIGRQPMVKVASAFTHLAGSDDANLDAFTHEQVTRFEAMWKQIQHSCDYPVCRHVLNSAGIIRFPEYQFDMVRLGLGLYGISHDEEGQTSLKCVSTMSTRISQIKHLKAGESVGYSRSEILSRDSVIATIAIGYADGLSRVLGHRNGWVWVQGQRAPIVGSVCMDMCMIDITGIEVNEGETVYLFGDQMPIQEIAKAAGTIPYEILTSVSSRVKRIYFHE